MPPLTPEQLGQASARLDGLTQRLEKTILDDICRRIAKAGTVTDTAEWQILRLKEMGEVNDVIEKTVSDYTKLSNEEVRQLFHEAAQVSDDFYAEMYTQSGKPFVPVEEDPYMQQLITATVDQTNNELVNLTQSMGFAVRQADGSTTFQPAAKAYQSALDLAQMQVATGTFDYTTAIRNSVRALTDGGLYFIEYESGHRNRADVAARRAILTGLSQMTGQVSKHNAEELETDIVEVTAHAGARPSHAEWQGRRYSLSGKSKEYPSLEEATGYGTGDGLKGWNCRHDFYPVFEFSPPAYTEEQLANIDPPPIEYNGKTLTYYECTQKQRAMETAMRKTKREIIAAQASGDDDMFTAKSIRLRRQKEEYANFSKSAGMLTQNERAQVYGFDRSVAAKASWAVRKADKVLDNGGGSGIMKSKGYDFLDGVLGSDKIPKEQSKSLDEIVSVIPKKHLDVIGKTVKEVEIVPNIGACNYDPVTKKLTLVPDKMNGSIIHEFGHILADAYDIYNDKEFLDILADGLDLDNGFDVKSYYFEAQNLRLYWISNPKFINDYQGRIYVDDDGFDYTAPIKPEQLKEYISVAFDAYFNNPELLKSKDKRLFDYLERMMNDV